MISPLPGATPTTPGSATRPLPGIVPEIVTKDGTPVPPGHGGFLVIKQPWPSMLRTLFNDDERYKSTYWSEVPGAYFTGDGARRDEDGNYWIMGRVDDVLNVSGHRLSTMEVESALVSHPKVAEAAVVGKPDELRGQAISAFVTLESGQVASDALKKELQAHVVKEIGALARPDDIRFTDALPKTRSGKIMRRLLRDIAAGRESAGIRRRSKIWPCWRSSARRMRFDAMSDLIDRLKARWVADGLTLRPGASPEALDAFEARYRVVLPPAFRRYLAAVDGMTGDLDRDWPSDRYTYCFWGLPALLSVWDYWSSQTPGVPSGEDGTDWTALVSFRRLLDPLSCLCDPADCRSRRRRAGLPLGSRTSTLQGRADLRSLPGNLSR